MIRRTKNFINNILNIGINQHLNLQDEKRLKLLNGVAFLTGSIFIITSIIVGISFYPYSETNLSLVDDYFFTSEANPLIFDQIKIIIPVFDFLAGVLFLSLLTLTARGKHRIAIFIFCSIAIVFSTYCYLSGKMFTVHFFLISGVLPILFYKRKRNYITFLLINYSLFIISTLIINQKGELSQSISAPAKWLIINMSGSYFLLFLITNYFKIANIRHEVKLQEHYDILNFQNKEIIEQRDHLYAKNQKINLQSKKIFASINYANRIQQAVFPQEDILNKHFADGFIFFKPRDIVSGDFYWMKERGNKLVLAVADCTGHGVPGAFMSLLGISFLNDCLCRINDLSAGEILDLMRDKVKRTLNQTGRRGEPKDGMDMVLCIIDKTTLEMQFAGAHNPLYLIRKSSEIQGIKDIDKSKTINHQNYSLIQIKGNAQPIAIHPKEKPFDTKYVQLLENDKLFAFSDGFSDQIGGSKIKKFQSKRLKKLLLENHQKPMSEQQIILDETHRNWRNGYRQLDDILVVGLKI